MARMSRGDDYPQQFDFTGQIIFISNKNMSSIDDAILSRSLTVDLSMTSCEKIERMDHILTQILPDHTYRAKSQALEFLKEKKDEINLSLRSLIITTKLVETYPDNWKDLANYMISTK
jgi:hypothetical protein